MADSVVITRFSPEVLLQQLELKNGWRKHSWYYNYENQSQSKAQDCDVLNLSAGESLDSLTSEIIKKGLEHYLDGFPGLFDITSFSVPRFNRYSEGQCMLRHVDHISSLFLPARDRGIPILSIVGLLNDDFEGGDFILCGEKVDLTAGSLIIFPSVFLFPHEITTISKGARYSFVSWAW